ncbi:hypothetical protein NDU88_006342 [Pleurodeles waltl]|uniref:Uncharacterized protein n=1 Tax=Pleurodeles waltl TaxID=8319 RepID=A0AAV7RRL7_PLEWA|nr:hypothetical protein NDU88_006342 [Pleurodeles waltl]
MAKPGRGRSRHCRAARGSRRSCGAEAAPGCLGELSEDAEVRRLGACEQTQLGKSGKLSEETGAARTCPIASGVRWCERGAPTPSTCASERHSGHWLAPWQQFELVAESQFKGTQRRYKRRHSDWLKQNRPAWARRRRQECLTVDARERRWL